MTNAISADRLLSIAESLLPVAAEAGVEMLRLRAIGLQITRKPDNTIVSNADLFADRFLAQHIGPLIPGALYVSEESAERRVQPSSDILYWCNDPLDSSRDFVDGGDSFSINIALINQGMPILGLIYMPGQNIGYIGIPGKGAFVWRNGILTPIYVAPPKSPYRIVVSSHSHGQTERLGQVLNGGTVESVRRMNGAVKFCLVAEGSMDLYPRFTSISEWDIAAGHAIVKAAGGIVTDLQNRELSYGKDLNYLCPHFIAKSLSR